MANREHRLRQAVVAAMIAGAIGTSGCESDVTDTDSIVSIREMEPNNTAATAQVLVLPVEVNGTTSSNGDGLNPPTILDQDIYSFTLTSDASVMFYLDGFGLAHDLDLDLTTVGDSGFTAPIISSLYPVGSPEGVKADLSPGTYLVRVYPFATAMTTTPYDLLGVYVGAGGSQSSGIGGGGGGGGANGLCTDSLVSEIESNNVYWLSDNIPFPGTMQGAVNTATDVYDWSSFVRSTSGTVSLRLTFTDTSANLDLALYDNDGATLLREGVRGTGSSESFSWTVTGGTRYYLRTRAVSTPGGPTQYSICVQ